MPKQVTSTEAKSRFGELLKWTTENQERVIVRLYGEPTAVIISYAEYEELENLRKREQKRKVLEALDQLRAEARQQNLDLADAEGYRLAGFSEEVIEETMKTDEALAASQK
ncbi:MAG: type II toxin-antitoxin system prevent-host-death family antitoxin [Caldilineaceae bacterium]|nr:type II toxin-antitoxin system prevent-host-death family antitoxin [Caldilineaceae bacterium]